MSRSSAKKDETVVGKADEPQSGKTIDGRAKKDLRPRQLVRMSDHEGGPSRFGRLAADPIRPHQLRACREGMVVIEIKHMGTNGSFYQQPDETWAIEKIEVMER